VPDTLPVHVNRTSLHSLEVPEHFETDDSFDVRLVNHGEPIHVHLHLDDTLSDVASIDAPNHHVDRESERRVGVTVTGSGSVFGKLKVVTSYGAETRYVDVDLSEPVPTDESVQVDESLSKPQPKATDPSGSDGETGDEGTTTDTDLPLGVLALGGVAVVLAVVVATVVEGFVAWAVALAVVLAVTAATAVLTVG